MKTQIFNLINGSEGTIRNLSSEKYRSNPIGFYCGKNNVPQNGGTQTHERMAVANDVAKENPAAIHILARGVEFTLTRYNSFSGRTWEWQAEITAEQYENITGAKAPVWTHKNAVNRYLLTIKGDCTVIASAYSGRKSLRNIIGEEFITIL